jgi:hypothetical protein
MLLNDEIQRGVSLMFRVSAATSVALFVIAASSGVAYAQQPQPWIGSGLFECSGGPAVAFGVGAEAKLTCVFHPARHRHPERYLAVVRRVGLDVGITDKLVLAWDVMTPTGRVPRGGLNGNYGGAGASIALGNGAASNAVLGGPGNLVSLQPRVANGTAGASVALGFQAMDISQVR